MEPRAIANFNGTLVPNPPRNGINNSLASRGSQTAPTTPANGRRASALWIRTPVENTFEHDDDGHLGDGHTDWNLILTPVPKTPAPEAIARFAANISPDTPSDSALYGQDLEDEDDEDARHAALMSRTCPPKHAGPRFFGLGEGVLSREKDERVLMRLMAARRKSLQFAPKVASPLSKAWN